jgi:hypothetical protein
LSAIAALLDGAVVLMPEELLEPEALLPEALSEPQAERVTAIELAATSRALRVRRVRFTSVVLLRVVRASAAVMATSREGVLRGRRGRLRYAAGDEPGRV